MYNITQGWMLHIEDICALSSCVTKVKLTLVNQEPLKVGMVAQLSFFLSTFHIQFYVPPFIGSNCPQDCPGTGFKADIITAVLNVHTALQD